MNTFFELNRNIFPKKFRFNKNIFTFADRNYTISGPIAQLVRAPDS